MYGILKSIIELVYPSRCPVCEEIIIPKGLKVCDLCKDKFKLIMEPRCKKCSKPIEQEEDEYCRDCQGKKYSYTYGYSLWLYEKDVKNSIIKFKYYYKKEYADYYTDEIIRHLGEKIIRIAPDIIAPVPIHWSKLRQRGYNQAEVLSRKLGEAMGFTVVSDLLIRNKKTLPQKQLSNKERFRNLQEAFEINYQAYSKLTDKLDTVLLIDDIYTTGSTIEACTRILKKHGINKVYFITLCISKGY